MIRNAIAVIVAIVVCACDVQASNDAAVEAGTTTKGESWVWVFDDFGSSLDAIGAHPSSFTHVSPTLYSVNYAYTSGVAYFSNCPTSGNACTAAGTDDFGGGLSSRQIAQRISSMGLACVPLIFGGARNNGVDTGVQRILDDMPAGTREAFIQSMVAEASDKGYAGYNLDFEVGASLGAAYAPKLVSFVSAFADRLHTMGMMLSIDLIGANVLQSACSSASGFVDLRKVAVSSVDRVVFEDYFARFGTASTACTTAADPMPCSDDFVSFLNLMCTYEPAGKTVIALESLPAATNPFAQQALATLLGYGMSRVAVWPGSNADGSGATYAFLDAKQLNPASDWYALLQQYLAHPK